MRTIKQLPKDVYSSLRSSVVLFDLTRVAEELIFNSIDANATKVNVSISVGTCYVKVDDDGDGITRDGLVLVGEKYATSKLQYLAEMDAATDSFGFRGEALSSLSDISLLEIITKARGMPNGYRKIIKSCKCLYLGIDNDKRGYGTTVTVRDLFYNQPVRRKYMQSSSNKVLHSVKKCVLRIALVHSQISFKVNDVESGNEILYTTPSLSPIPLVSSGFGTDVSRSLCEVNFSDEVLSVSGYLSAPAATFSMKALQYIYINSRFICKSPIHKLLNNLAASLNSLDTWEDALEPRSGKRCKLEAYPAFILNLRCARSSYDLTFEPSKTLAEFKDWIPILTFIEQGFRCFWRRNPPRGGIRNNQDEVAQKDEIRKKEETIQDLITADKSMKSTFPIKNCKILLNQSSLHLSPFSTSHSEDSDMFSQYKYERKRSRESRGNTTNFKEHQTKAVNNHQSDITFHDMAPTSSNACLSKCASMVSPEHCVFQQSAHRQDDYLFCDLKLRQDTANDPNNDNLGARWGEESLGVDADLAEVSMADQLTFDVSDYRNEIPFPSRCSKGLKKPFLRGCSSRGIVTPGKPSFGSHQQSSNELRTKERPLVPEDRIGDIDADVWHLSPFSTSTEIHSEDSDILSHYKYERKRSRESHGNTTNFKEHQTKAVNNHQNNITFHDLTPTSACISKCASMVSPEHCIFQQSAHRQDDYLFCELKLRQDTANEPNHDNLGARWGEESLGVDADLAEVSVADQLTSDVSDYRNEIPFPSRCSKGLKKPFLRGCSSRGIVTPEKPSFGIHQQSSIQINELGTKERPLPPEDRTGDIDADEWDHNIDFLVNTSLKKSVVVTRPHSSSLLECSMMDMDILSMDFVKPCIYDTPHFVKERDLLNDSLVKVERKGLDHFPTDSALGGASPFSIFGTTPQKVQCFADKFAEERNFRSCRSASFADGDDEFLAYDKMHNGFIDMNYAAAGCTDLEFDFENFVSPKRNCSMDLVDRSLSKDVTFQNVGSSNRLVDDMDWQSFNSFNMDEANNCTGPTSPSPSPLHHTKGMNARSEFISQNTSRYSVCKGRSRRCNSAPPFYKRRNKFSTTLSCMTTTATKPDAEKVQTPPIFPGPETSESKQPSHLSGEVSHGYETKLVEESSLNSRKYVEDPYSIQDMKGVEKNDCQKKSKLFQLHNTDRVEDIISNEMENSKFAGTKWRHDDRRISTKKVRDFQDGDESHNLSEETDVLDVSSGILLLAGGSVVPDSISKECLDNAKVLIQLDKKFIPFVGGSILAVIDQHAADERIRLEELRQKVLCGEGKTVTYLDSEQELVLPEIGYQLLQNYAEQMQHWGWICNVDSQNSGSFTKKLKLLHRRQSAISLIAVPCILGVNLSDKDLLEFLEQLYDTDGSSTMPPSVLRVLNFKACRGAIMFGDALLPSECSLIVEELKQTSLCFQCAHGRPTTAPLVNLGALHKQISNLRSWSKDSDEVWHGLHRHRPSLERAAKRLSNVGE
ncbi:hypothetical protein MKW94_003808 [Papaver nudicaule]|uniref:DNA mismatch repair protein MLH3 n=1 Tax=Papaver nudicaule TaxID=74823 RepID=A0AA41RPS7_PAPNU|nr:hypothetical protein [Papaver nudicaule]